MIVVASTIEWPAVVPRLAVVAAALAVWFRTQSLIGRRAAAADRIGDRLHDWTARWHAWFAGHPRATNRSLVASSLVIDLCGLFLVGSALFGPSFAPFLALMIVFALRQACQGLCRLPLPPGKIWHHPGFPSLLVTYHVSNDLFFSGHTAVTVLGALEVARLGLPWLTAPVALVAFAQMLFVIVLRGHYTLDVVAGALAAFFGHVIARDLAPWVDRWLGFINLP